MHRRHADTVGAGICKALDALKYGVKCPVMQPPKPNPTASKGSRTRGCELHDDCAMILCEVREDHTSPGVRGDEESTLTYSKQARR